MVPAEKTFEGSATFEWTHTKTTTESTERAVASTYQDVKTSTETTGAAACHHAGGIEQPLVRSLLASKARRGRNRAVIPACMLCSCARVRPMPPQKPTSAAILADLSVVCATPVPAKSRVEVS